MSNKIFISDRHFTVFDFIISHGQLLLRAGKGEDNSKNIDIIFWGVRYIQLPTSLSGIAIKIVNDHKRRIAYDFVNAILGNDTNHLFEIESINEEFYVIASHFEVYKNDLEFNETSLGLHEIKTRGQEIARSN